MTKKHAEVPLNTEILVNGDFSHYPDKIEPWRTIFADREDPTKTRRLLDENNKPYVLLAYDQGREGSSIRYPSRYLPEGLYLLRYEYTSSYKLADPNPPCTIGIGYYETSATGFRPVMQNYLTAPGWQPVQLSPMIPPGGANIEFIAFIVASQNITPPPQFVQFRNFSLIRLSDKAPIPPLSEH